MIADRNFLLRSLIVSWGISGCCVTLGVVRLSVDWSIRGRRVGFSIVTGCRVIPVKNKTVLININKKLEKN